MSKMRATTTTAINCMVPVLKTSTTPLPRRETQRALHRAMIIERRARHNRSGQGPDGKGQVERRAGVRRRAGDLSYVVGVTSALIWARAAVRGPTLVRSTPAASIKEAESGSAVTAISRSVQAFSAADTSAPLILSLIHISEPT